MPIQRSGRRSYWSVRAGLMPNGEPGLPRNAYASEGSAWWGFCGCRGIGPIVALAFMAAIEDINRFRRMRSVGAYLGLTTRRYQSSETDVVLGISRQGDAMARHYLYEAANVLLTTVRRPS